VPDQVLVRTLYPFRFRDRLTGEWVRARDKLQVPAMQRRYTQWEIIGAPEIRHVTPGSVEAFNPFRPQGPTRAIIAPHAALPALSRLSAGL
jgi:hypothetical protein